MQDVFDPLDYLGVGYHYNGHFVKKDGIIYYSGQLEAEASIERDQLSYKYSWRLLKIYMMWKRNMSLRTDR